MFSYMPVHLAAHYLLSYRQICEQDDERKHQVICPICLSSFRSFSPAWGRGRASQCAVCGSMERQRHQWLTFTEDHGFFDPQTKILHFAPEKAFKDILKFRLGENYVDCDINPEVATHVIDIADISYGSDSFERIVCSHVLEHVPDDRRAMRELRRTLKEGGVAYLIVPAEIRESTYEDPEINTPAMRKQHFNQSDHYRIYGRNDFVKRLEEAGFCVKMQFAKERFGEQISRRLGLGETIYICA